MPRTSCSSATAGPTDCRSSRPHRTWSRPSSSGPAFRPRTSFAEKLGVPAAAIMTDRFVRMAWVMASSLGLPDYPFVTIPHPLSNNTEQEIDAKAEEAVRLCIALIQSPDRGL